MDQTQQDSSSDARVTRQAPRASPLPRLLSKPEVLELIGVTYPTLWKWMRANAFPGAVVLVGGKIIGWRDDEIAAWIAARPRRRFKGDPPDPATVPLTPHRCKARRVRVNIPREPAET